MGGLWSLGEVRQAVNLTKAPPTRLVFPVHSLLSLCSHQYLYLHNLLRIDLFCVTHPSLFALLSHYFSRFLNFSLYIPCLNCKNCSFLLASISKHITGNLEYVVSYNISSIMVLARNIPFSWPLLF